MSDQLVCVPDIGSFHDVPVVEVLVKVGDSVRPEDPLLLIESDKAMMEVPAPSAGVVGELLLKVGDTVSAGTPVLRLATASTAPAAATVASVADALPQAALHPIASTGVALTGVAVTGVALLQAELSPDHAPVARAPTEPYASPSVRKLARERGVDLHGIHGSGPFGRILPADLAAAGLDTQGSDTQGSDTQGSDTQGSDTQGSDTPGSAIPFDLPPWPDTRAADHGTVHSRPLTRVQRLSGPALHRNWVSIPHVTCFDVADVTALEQFRKEINLHGTEPKVSLLVLVLRALVAALREHPALNASIEGDQLVLKDYCHVGVAVDSPHGLFVPVIHDCQRLGVREIAAELARLAAKAQKGTLQPAEMQGGSFTVSSLGGIGGGHFTPVINAPEVAILGLGKAEWRQVSSDGQTWQARLMLPLSLSFDHRALDGAAAARFNRTLAGHLADLRRVLL